MLADGLFEQFSCDSIHGLHNRPGMPVGEFSIAPGTAMVAGAFFDIAVIGKDETARAPTERLRV